MRLSTIRVNWEICCWPVDDHCGHAVVPLLCSFCPHGFALPSIVALPLPLPLPLSFCSSRVLWCYHSMFLSVLYILFGHHATSTNPNSSESSLLAVSTAPTSNVFIKTSATLTSIQTSGTLAGASISPEFLASVIQVIQLSYNTRYLSQWAHLQFLKTFPPLPLVVPPLLLVLHTWTHVVCLNHGPLQLHQIFSIHSLQTGSPYHWVFCFRIARGWGERGEPAMVLVQFEYLRSDSEHKLLIGQFDLTHVK